MFKMYVVRMRVANEISIKWGVFVLYTSTICFKEIFCCFFFFQMKPMGWYTQTCLKYPFEKADSLRIVSVLDVNGHIMYKI